MAYLWIVVTRENAIEILVMAMTSTKMKRLNCSASTFEFGWKGKQRKWVSCEQCVWVFIFMRVKITIEAIRSMKSTGSRIEGHRLRVEWMDGFDFAFWHVQHFLRTHSSACVQRIGCFLIESFLIGTVIRKKSPLIGPSHLLMNDQMTMEHAIK